MARRQQQRDPTENLPDGTAHVVVLRTHRGPIPESDDLLGPSEMEEYVRGMSSTKGESGVYHPGDEFPLEPAGRSWTGQPEAFAAFDSEGARLDDPTPSRQPGGSTDERLAIIRWKANRFGEEAAFDELEQWIDDRIDGRP